MSTHKDEKTGTWYVMVRYRDWKGEKKQKCKRGFAIKREAQDWERTFQLKEAGDLDMTFEAFLELYERDMRPRLKENTWLSKEHMIRTKLLPDFGKRMISEIGTKDIIAWQNELLAYLLQHWRRSQGVYPGQNDRSGLLSPDPDRHRPGIGAGEHDHSGCTPGRGSAPDLGIGAERTLLQVSDAEKRGQSSIQIRRLQCENCRGGRIPTGLRSDR